MCSRALLENSAAVNALNFDRLLKLRLVVARVSEMDLAKWWNTNGLLAGSALTDFSEASF